jgi:hypothetical protein
VTSPVFGYSTLQVIPSLDGASAAMNRQLAPILAAVGTSAGRDLGASIADGLAQAGGDVSAAVKRITDSASSSAGSAGDELGRQLGAGIDGGLESSISGVGTDSGRRVGENIEAGLAEGTRGLGSDLGDQLRSQSTELERRADQVGRDAGGELAAGVNDSFRSGTADLGNSLDPAFASLGSQGFSAGQEAGSDIASGVLSGLAEAGVEIGGEFAELGVEAAARGADLGGAAASGVTSGLASGLAESAAGISNVLGDALGPLGPALTNPATAAGGIIGLALVKGAIDSINFDGVRARLRAELGATELEAERLSGLSKDLFRGNYGGSVEQVAAAVADVRRNAAGLGASTTAELRQISAAALTTAAVWDQDLNQSINAASQLVRTGLVDNSTEAFDLITVGLQGVADKSGDLLDTFNEYSTQFRELGLEGEEALGLITQGIQAGARDADIAADTLKEFAIRAQDGSDTTISGLQALGLEWTAVSDAIAAGGPRASAALDRVLDELRKVEDPAQQAAIAVQLFGTQSEDMQNALLAMDLSTAANEIGEISGAAQDAQDDLAGLESSLETVKRAGLGLGEDVANFILEPIAGLIQAENWGDVGQQIGRLILDGILLPVTGVAGLIARALGFSTGEASELGESTGAALATGFEAGVAKHGWNVAELLGVDIDLVRTKSLDAREATTSFGRELDRLEFSGAMARSGLDAAAAGADAFLQSLEDSTSIDNLLSATLAVDDAMSRVFESVNQIGDLDVSDVAEGLQGVSGEARAALSDIMSAGDAAQQSIAAALEFRGADSARATADRIRDGLLGIFDAAGLSDSQTHELLETMGLLPEQVDVAIAVSGETEAMAKIQVLREFIGGQLDAQGNVHLNAFIGAKIAEGDWATAQSLVEAFAIDMQDGLLENPLLIALNADPTMATEGLTGWIDWAQTENGATVPVDADTVPASDEVNAWERFMLGRPSIDVPVGANTNPADIGVSRWGAAQQGKTFTLDIDADMSRADATIREWFQSRGLFQGVLGGLLPERQLADGGHLGANEPAIVGEKGWELWWPDSAGQILNQSQVAATFGATEAGNTYEISIEDRSGDPMDTAGELIRQLDRRELKVT